MSESHLDSLAWCETIAAMGAWHLRRLSDAGRKPHGGADTESLCGLKAAWDVGPEVTTEAMGRRPAYGYPCRRCVATFDGDS